MEPSYKLQVFLLLDNMTATISINWVHWEWMSLLVNRGKCALKFWVIEFVKVIVLPYNMICRFRGCCKLQRGRTTMKLPPPTPTHPLTTHTDTHTETETHSALLTQFPISHCICSRLRESRCATINLRWYFVTKSLWKCCSHFGWLF